MLLGLDLGQNMGWVKCKPETPDWQYGTFVLRDTTDLGKWLVSADPFLREVLSDVTGVAVEQPFMGDDYFPCRKLMAMLGHLHYLCAWQDECRFVKEIAVSTGKKALSGYGKSNGPQMITAAHNRGIPVTDEHQAHAAGIWWACQFGANG